MVYTLAFDFCNVQSSCSLRPNIQSSLLQMASNRAASKGTIRLMPLRSIDPEPDEMFYLRVERPEIHGIALCGPFHCIDAIFPNLCQYLNETQTGMQVFEEATKGATLINQFRRLVAPLDSDPSKTIIIEMISVKNAELMARLPCPVYNVLCCKPFRRGDGQGVRDTGIQRSVELESMDILGSFAAEGAAVTFAREILGENVKEVPSGRKFVRPNNIAGSQGSFYGVVHTGTLSVQRDSGATWHPNNVD